MSGAAVRIAKHPDDAFKCGHRYQLHFDRIKREAFEYRIAPDIVVSVRLHRVGDPTATFNGKLLNTQVAGFWIECPEIVISEYVAARDWTTSIYCNTMARVLKDIVEARILRLWEFAQALGPAELHAFDGNNADAVRLVGARVTEFISAGNATPEDLKQAKAWLNKSKHRTIKS